MFGWCGTVLDVDLTRQTFERKILNPDVARDFLGGRGLNAKMLFDGVDPGVDALGPENLLCFTPGILTATTLGLSSRLMERQTHMALVRVWYEKNGYDPAAGQPARQTCERLNIAEVA